MPESLAERAVVRIAKSRHIDRLAVRALLRANELLGLALGVRLAKLRDSGDRLAAAFADSEANALQARVFAEAAEIVGARWDKIPERRRPHYTPSQRFRILRLRRILGLSQKETARWFRVSSNTVARWESVSEEESEIVGSLVKPTPRVRRYADVVRELVQTMTLLGFGGQQKVAQTLARAGWMISKRTVGRILKEELPKPPSDEPRTALPVLRARGPNHIWMCDITEVAGFLGLFRFKLLLVLDVFARIPLAFKVFDCEPTASQVSALVRYAARLYGPPRHFVSDQGAQFTSRSFGAVLRRLGVRHRFGAIGRTGSIAIIERFWRTMKEGLRRYDRRPLVKAELERRLQRQLLFYAFFRPHQGLDGASPAEVYFGVEQKEVDRAAPPRAVPGEESSNLPFSIAFLDREERLPILLSRAA